MLCFSVLWYGSVWWLVSMRAEIFQNISLFVWILFFVWRFCQLAVHLDTVQWNERRTQVMNDWVLFLFESPRSWRSDFICPWAEGFLVIRVLYQLEIQVLKKWRRFQGFSLSVPFGIKIFLIIRVDSMIPHTKSIQFFGFSHNKGLRRLGSICVFIFNVHSILLLVGSIKVLYFFGSELNIRHLQVLKTFQLISGLKWKKLSLVGTIQIQCLKFWRILRRLLQLCWVVRCSNFRS